MTESDDRHRARELRAWLISSDSRERRGSYSSTFCVEDAVSKQETDFDIV